MSGYFEFESEYGKRLGALLECENYGLAPIVGDASAIDRIGSALGIRSVLESDTPLYEKGAQLFKRFYKHLPAWQNGGLNQTMRQELNRHRFSMSSQVDSVLRMAEPDIRNDLSYTLPVALEAAYHIVVSPLPISAEDAIRQAIQERRQQGPELP